MFRHIMIGLLAVAGLATIGWSLVQRRPTGRFAEYDAVQWPFDPGELRDLMDRVIDEQRAHVATIENTAGRVRAEAFLTYYECRRRAIAS